MGLIYLLIDWWWISLQTNVKYMSNICQIYAYYYLICNYFEYLLVCSNIKIIKWIKIIY